MTNRLELNWKLDGFVDEQRCYLSETTIDTNTPPSPVAVLSGDVRSHVETELTLGKYYYTRISAVKNSVEKFSDEKRVLFGKPWTPANLANSAKVWLSSDSVDVDSSNRVGRMIDLSGNNNHFMQSYNDYKPLKTSGLIRFDGINDSLSCVNFSLFRNISNAWVFSVFKKRGSDVSVAGSCVFYVSANESATNRFNLLAKRYGTGLLSFAARSGITDTTAVISSTIVRDGQFVLAYAEAKYSSGSTKLRTNAVDDATGTITAQNTSNNDAKSSLGGGDTSISSADIDLYCHIVGIGSTPSLAEIQKLEGWAAHKYGLTNNLPAGHPYKNLIPTL